MTMTNNLPKARVMTYYRRAAMVPGDFSAQHYKDVNEVRVPEQVLLALRSAVPAVKHGVLASDFLKAAFAHGNELATALKWTPSEVYNATRKLNNRLVNAGAIKDSMLIS